MNKKKWIFIVGGAFVLVAATFVIGMLIGTPLEVGRETLERYRAAGKCVQCHRRETPAIVATFELSPHSEAIICLVCHQPLEGQKAMDHNGFEIVRAPTAGNCAQCHETEYEEFLRSRHAAPAWTAVAGIKGEFNEYGPLTEEQIAHAAQFHPDAMNRGPNPLAVRQGEGALEKGCAACHEIGAPNPDGSVGNCSKCHLRHSFRVEESRLPETCGSCHQGPDHSMLEIYQQSTHGVLFAGWRNYMNLSAKPSELTVDDMLTPTCATCHMSTLGSDSMTHDVGERLSYYLFAEISEKRDNGQENRERMKATCKECHSTTHVEMFFAKADRTLRETNEQVGVVKEIVDALYADGYLTEYPYDEPAEFEWFDYWHYFGRAAKHGAYMGGSDYVQWYGNYEMLRRLVEWEQLDRELRGLE